MASPTVFSAVMWIPFAWVRRFRSASSLAAFSAPSRACAGLSERMSGAPEPVAFSTCSCQSTLPARAESARPASGCAAGLSAPERSNSRLKKTGCITRRAPPPSNVGLGEAYNGHGSGSAVPTSLLGGGVLDPAADQLPVSLGEEGEAHTVGGCVLGLHPLSHHLALGVDDLRRAGELELEPHPLPGVLRLEQPSQANPTRADVPCPGGVGNAGHVLVEEDVDLRPSRPALLGHRFAASVRSHGPG